MMYRLKRWLLALFSPLILSSCTPTQLINAFVSTDVLRVADIAYGELDRQQLDIYLPGGAVQRPVIIFVHGGYWDTGSKDDYLFLADTFIAEGYAVVIPNYRLVPTVTFPAYIEDIAQAVAWVFDNASEYNFDLSRITLMGHSAGAHMAALVAFDERYLAAFGYSNTALHSFIGLAGPYNFLPLDPGDVRAQAALGPPEGYPLTQPINFVQGTEPPAFLATGLADRTVDPQNTLSMAARISEAGGRVQLMAYEGINHIDIVGGLARVARFVAPQVLPDILEFLRGLS
jgi:acetyl esterase/lipase